MTYESVYNLISDKISGEWGTDNLNGDGVFVLRTTNFTNRGEIDYTNVVSRNIDARKVAKKKLLPGDIMIEKSGGSPSQPVGRVVFFDGKMDCTYLCNNFTAILRPLGKVYPRYLFHALFFMHKQKITLKYQNKTTGIINLQLDRYLEENIPLPSLLEQRRIAAILDNADEIRNKRQQVLALCDEFLKSTFLDMFGDPVKNQKQWPIVKFGNVTAEIKYGTNNKSIDIQETNALPVLRIPNVIHDQIDFNVLKYSIISQTEKKRLLLKKGDLLFVRTNGNPEYIGRCAVFNSDLECLYASYLIRVRLLDEIGLSAEFIQFCFSFPTYRKRMIREAKTTAGNYNLNTQGLKSLELIMPPTDIQQRFLDILEFVNTIKARLKASAEEAETLFNSLSQRAFKGEL